MSATFPIPGNDGLSSGTIYTVGEVADVLRISRMSVYRLIHAGHLQSLKVGRTFRVTQTALDRFLTQADYTPSSSVADSSN